MTKKVGMEEGAAMGWVLWGRMAKAPRPQNTKTGGCVGCPTTTTGCLVSLLPADVDECEEGLGQCGPFSVCLNVLGSYRCECHSGYRPAEDGHGCVCKCQPHRVGHRLTDPSTPRGSPHPSLCPHSADPCS